MSHFRGIVDDKCRSGLTAQSGQIPGGRNLRFDGKVFIPVLNDPGSPLEGGGHTLRKPVVAVLVGDEI
jgi:hypothetical protein